MERDRCGDIGVDVWIILGWICGVRVVCGLLVGKREGKAPLRDLDVGRWIILGRIFGTRFVYVHCGETGEKDTTGEN